MTGQARRKSAPTDPIEFVPLSQPTPQPEPGATFAVTVAAIGVILAVVCLGAAIVEILS